MNFRNRAGLRNVCDFKGMKRSEGSPRPVQGFLAMNPWPNQGPAFLEIYAEGEFDVSTGLWAVDFGPCVSVAWNDGLLEALWEMVLSCGGIALPWPWQVYSTALLLSLCKPAGCDKAPELTAGDVPDWLLRTGSKSQVNFSAARRAAFSAFVSNLEVIAQRAETDQTSLAARARKVLAKAHDISWECDELRTFVRALDARNGKSVFQAEKKFSLESAGSPFDRSPGEELVALITSARAHPEEFAPWNELSDGLIGMGHFFEGALASLRALSIDPESKPCLDRIMKRGGLEFIMAEAPHRFEPPATGADWPIQGTAEAQAAENQSVPVSPSPKASPAVTILMPTYNRGKLAAEAISSVISQSFADWELLVLEDGLLSDSDGSGGTESHERVKISPASSRQAAGRQVRELTAGLGDGRIKLLPLPRLGLSGVLNAGIAAAGGRYIAYLDDDDIWYPHHLETLMARMTTGSWNRERVVYSRSKRAFGEYSDGGFRPVQVKDHEYIPFSAERIHTRNLLSVLNALHTRELAVSVGGFNEGLVIGMDWDFWARCAFEAEFEMIDEHTGEYRIYSGNMTQKWKQWGLLHLGPLMVGWLRSGRGLSILARAAICQGDDALLELCLSRYREFRSGRKNLVFSSEEMGRTLSAMLDAFLGKFGPRNSGQLLQISAAFALYHPARAMKGLIGEAKERALRKLVEWRKARVKDSSSVRGGSAGQDPSADDFTGSGKS